MQLEAFLGHWRQFLHTDAHYKQSAIVAQPTDACLLSEHEARNAGHLIQLCVYTKDNFHVQLEAFLGHWRQFLQPKHGLVFSQLNGAPVTMQAVYKIFNTSAFRISGKKTNPHLVRDMVVTYLRLVSTIRLAITDPSPSSGQRRPSCPSVRPSFHTEGQPRASRCCLGPTFSDVGI